MAKLQTDSKTCGDAGITDPLGSYKKIYDPPPYTPQERKDWETAMIARAKARNETFNPADYPDESTPATTA